MEKSRVKGGRPPEQLNSMTIPEHLKGHLSKIENENPPTLQVQEKLRLPVLRVRAAKPMPTFSGHGCQPFSGEVGGNYASQKAVRVSPPRALGQCGFVGTELPACGTVTLLPVVGLPRSWGLQRAASGPVFQEVLETRGEGSEEGAGRARLARVP